jgi:arylsulfatase A
MKTLRALFTFLALLCAASTAAERKPNILFILADDFGINGVSCYGSDQHKTPQIDSLAASGTRFETCYASPLCGPTRGLLLTGRYAFRTGSITNGSWRGGGPGAKAADEPSIARTLKAAGYATAQAGKWRQVGETPRDWGFDEYITDPTAGGWFWQNKHLKNGEEITVAEGTYAPDVMHEFSLDFIRRHKDRPFFLYYSSHLMHGPILRTPDSPKEAAQKRGGDFYEDNIRYLDKQVGALVAEIEKLGLREKTLIVFSADNGTARQGTGSTIGGRALSGQKGTMLEGGSRVPFIASWPGVTPAGRVHQDLVSFADLLPTFAEVGGAKLPEGVKIDGRSFAPQLRGEKGQPREWAYVQLGAKWFVREAGYKMDETGALFDMSDAPFVEKPIAPAADTDASKAARARLTGVLAELNPAAGKTDGGGKAKPAGKKRKRNKA